ncbi:type II toxin-antitoxin system RelE family toxin [Stomatobaculum longum]|jgi:toxin-antitoxin system, toxin component, relE family|uniref:type II toxin-antitoxin system RelE family toxin n=1 Tax=Stomatobaculum longum TaxID=796942 RepID=UPI0028EEF6F0|nr:type II toxin-antitoxin system RelE/ParE family toxin [Stomatobaculum longum]
MNWQVEYLPEAVKDLKRLDASSQVLTLKAIQKVQADPRPAEEGGLGKPLGNKGGQNLSGFLKIKLLKAGIRIVYTLVREKDKMLIVVIGVRADNEVYEQAAKRRKSHGL